MKTILGISLGTRSIGMAMLINGELVDWYVKSFKGVWNKHKKDLILDTVERMMDRYDIGHFSIKLPEQLERHQSVRDLNLAINLFAQHRTIPTHSFTIEEMKQLLGEKIKNKRLLRDRILNLFPELRHEFTKAYLHKNAYYAKLFEAVAAAYLTHQAQQYNQ